MSVRNEELSAEERSAQEALNRSWDAAQHALRDPDMRGRLERAIERVNGSMSSEMMTAAEFLAATDPSR